MEVTGKPDIKCIRLAFCHCRGHRRSQLQGRCLGCKAPGEPVCEEPPASASLHRLGGKPSHPFLLKKKKRVIVVNVIQIYRKPIQPSNLQWKLAGVDTRSFIHVRMNIHNEHTEVISNAYWSLFFVKSSSPMYHYTINGPRLQKYTSFDFENKA